MNHLLISHKYQEEKENKSVEEVFLINEPVKVHPSLCITLSYNAVE